MSHQAIKADMRSCSKGTKARDASGSMTSFAVNRTFLIYPSFRIFPFSVSIRAV
jgi:hypothetical protein